MATGGEFYFLIEKYLFCKDFAVYSSSSSQKSPANNDNSLNDEKSMKNTPKIGTLDSIPLENSSKLKEKPNSKPFFLRLISTNLQDWKSPINNDSASCYSRLPKDSDDKDQKNSYQNKKDCDKNFINFDKSFPNSQKDKKISEKLEISQKSLEINKNKTNSMNSSESSDFSPDRKAKKSFTTKFPKSPLSQITRHQKRHSTLMATHYDRDILIHQALENYTTNFADISRYIRIKIPYFIDMIIRFLYEIPELDGHLKLFYVTVIKNFIVDNSCYNAAFLAKDFVIMRLMLCLRLENEEVIREEICRILMLILGNFMNNHHLSAIFNLLQFNMNLRDFCQCQLNKNRRKNKSAILEKSQIGVLFSAELNSYEKGLNSIENYYNCSQNLLKLLLNLIKDSPKNENSQKILNFSGQNSGIVFTNMRFPIHDFSMIFELFFDNLLSTDKREMPNFYYNPQQSPLKSQTNVEILKKLENLKINEKSGEISKKLEKAKSIEKSRKVENIEKNFCGKTMEKTIKVDDLSKYLPRIFTLTSNDNCSFLDVYLNEKRELTIELLDVSRNSLCLDTFKHKFEEKKAYNLIINYNNEKFDVFLNHEELLSNKTTFPKLSEKFLYPKYFSLCCSPMKLLHINSQKLQDFKKLLPLTIENSLSGTLSFFKLMENSQRMNDLKNLKNLKISKNSKISKLCSKSLNLNIFEFLLRHNFMSENTWVSLVKSEPCSSENQQVFVEERAKSKLDFMNKFINKLMIWSPQNSAIKEESVINPIDNQPFDVKCKGVDYLEKICFLDFFLMFGNVEVFIYMIDLLATEEEFLENEKWYFIHNFLVFFRRFHDFYGKFHVFLENFMSFLRKFLIFSKNFH